MGADDSAVIRQETSCPLGGHLNLGDPIENHTLLGWQAPVQRRKGLIHRPGAVGTQYRSRYLRMIEPEDKWLSVKEAQVLLTASSKWANQQKTSGKYRTRVAIGEIKPLPMPKATAEEPSAESSQWVERDFDQSQSRTCKTDKIGQFQTKMIQDTGLGND